MSATSRRLGKLLADGRKQQRMTRAQLAEVVKIPFDTLENVERGFDTCSLDLYRRLFEAVGLRFRVTAVPRETPPTDTVCQRCFETIATVTQ